LRPSQAAASKITSSRGQLSAIRNWVVQMSTVTERNGSRGLTALRLTAIGVCCVGIAAVLGVLVLNKKFIVFLVEDVGENHSVWIYSRFRGFPEVHTGDGPVTLMAFVFPGSRWTDDTDV